VNVLALLEQCGGIEDIGLRLRWDAAALHREVVRRASILAHVGIKPGSVVAIGHGGTTHFFADLFACWHVGAVAACLDSSLTPGELKNVLGFANPAAFLVDKNTMVEGLQIPVVDLTIEQLGISPAPASAPAPENPALVLFTSGTTGTPKGVVLTYGALQARIAANIAAIGRPALARALVSLPTHFGHGLIGNSLTPLFAGGGIVLHPLGIPLANDLGRIIDEHGITFMSSVPSFWRLVLGRSPRPALASLVRVHVGSAPFPAVLWSEVVAWTGAEVVNCYGTTETANWISGASSKADGIADGLIGKMWGGQAAVLDDNGSLQNTGAGEILIKSPSLMSGYLDRPDLSAAALFDGWYRTGDRGTIDQQGCLRLAGRLKDEINRAGFKVQPAEIDTLLERHPSVAEACVFGINDPLGGEAIAAAIRLADGASATPQSLQAWCRERLRREAVPENWFFVAEIPRTARGKVSRDAVRRALIAEPTDTLSASSANSRRTANAIDRPLLSNAADIHSVRSAVKFAWTKVLGQESFDADVPLPETDVDSLDVLRLWLLLETQLGSHLSMDVLDTEPTPSQLVSALEQQLRAGSDATALQISSQSPPTVFLMLPAGGDLPDLARFRATLKSKIRFALVQYPEWREMIEAGSDFNALVDFSVAQICAQSREKDDVMLAGYSFGGLVAIEATRKLLERGRRVSFVGLIDTRAVDPQPVGQRLRRFISRRTPQKGSTTQSQTTGQFRTRVTGPPSRWQALISALILVRAFRTLKVVGRLDRVLPEKQAFTLDSAINWRLRTESLRRLRLKSLEAPVTLFRSDEGQRSKDYGWGTICSRLTVIPIGGTHETMMSHPTLEHLCRQFQNAVESASYSTH
jgi:acyl-CoA synthetase (AMP-forming)/AMP-acid ligase II/thioesterase domain-containing protein/acyl carrier protein